MINDCPYLRCLSARSAFRICLANKIRRNILEYWFFNLYSLFMLIIAFLLATPQARGGSGAAPVPQLSGCRAFRSPAGLARLLWSRLAGQSWTRRLGPETWGGRQGLSVRQAVSSSQQQQWPSNNTNNTIPRYQHLYLSPYLIGEKNDQCVEKGYLKTLQKFHHQYVP